MNPITKLDYPDPDIIRVDDVYYMISSTWHFMPGGAILKSYDLQNWEIVSYLFDELEKNDNEKLVGEMCNYGRGMEAGRLYYHNGKFYASFFVRWYNKLFLFSADSVEGPWKSGFIEGGFFDGHLLFDEDRVFVVFGYGKLWITELLPDLSKEKTGGFGRLVLEDREETYVPYCSPRIYHINDKYYIFVMHWPKTGIARRTHMCFVADSLEDEFKGKEVLCDDGGYYNQGIAQGGIVDTPDHNKWFAMLYQDHGAVGRIPYLVPVKFDEQKFPVFGVNGKAVNDIEVVSSRPYYPYEPLVTSDDFCYQKAADQFPVIKKQWQWNHVPNKELIDFMPSGGLKITTGKIAINLIHAQNTLTQKMLWPKSEASVLVDASGIKDGDVAGICALQACYGLVGITKEMGQYYLVVIERDIEDSPKDDVTADFLPGTMKEKILLDGPIARLKIHADFNDRKDYCEFYYEKKDKWMKIGKKHDLYFKIDHYVGCRYGLFIYSTKNIGGSVVFQNFEYDYE